MNANTVEEAHRYIGGAAHQFEAVNRLWRELKAENRITLARLVLTRLRKGEGLLNELPADRKTKAKLCQQHAEVTSKDLELGMETRHDLALNILSEMFDLDDPGLDGDAETLGIAGGICKRRWMDLGQYEDLIRAAAYYTRGAKSPVGNDGYAHINAAFMQDLLAQASN